MNRDGLRFLDACLSASLDQEVDGGHEVLLVDNGSSDGSAEHVRQRHQRVRVIEAGRNLGFAAGNNLGIREARGELVVLLNNDTRVRPGWLQALVEVASADPRAGAVTSKLLFAEPAGVIQNAGSLLLSDGSGGDRGSGEPDAGQFDKREEVFAFCGAAALLRREALADVGVFDEDYFMYYEDTDLSWRLRLRGWRVVYEPRAVVDHWHAASSGRDSKFMRFHADRNRLFTVLKNAPPSFVGRSFLSLGRRAAAPTGPAGTPREGSKPRVLASFAAHLPAMLARRLRIRARRTAPDAEVLRWIYSRERWDARS